MGIFDGSSCLLLRLCFIPTQIAELFKSNGFDGVFYKSALSEGLNLALFDLNAAAMVNCFVSSVREIKFSFEPLR